MCAGLPRVMSRCRGVDQAVTEIPVTDFDVHAFLLSLPRLLGTTSIERIPANVPYLDCDPELVERWQARLASRERKRPRSLRLLRSLTLPARLSPILLVRGHRLARQPKQ